jgi:hypothetical protein
MTFDSAITNRFISKNTETRISNLDDGCTAEVARHKVAEWHKTGAFVVANAGAYDILGLNHLRGLTQARIIGAAYKLGDFENLSAIYDLASSDEIRLILSLDTNEAITENKSKKSIGGGSIRPSLDWQTRATMLSLQAVAGKHDMVDFITRHGPNSCRDCQDETCWHSDKTYNVASTGADLTVVKSLSESTRNRYPENTFHVVDESDGAFFDKVLDSQISTSALIRRVRQDKERE